jgi:hypothetical protein
LDNFFSSTINVNFTIFVVIEQIIVLKSAHLLMYPTSVAIVGVHTLKSIQSSESHVSIAVAGESRVSITVPRR